ncbi:MAG: hypothetical protein AAGC95_17965 [Pseudomonadota bacterium]
MAVTFVGYGLFTTRLAPPVSTTLEETTLEERRAARISAYARTWPTAPSYDVAFQPLGSGPKARGADRAVFDAKDDYWGLPRTEGYALVDVYCTGCHSLQIVMQQRGAPERWVYLLEWMVEDQNMPPLAPEDETVVLAYLSRHFGD